MFEGAMKESGAGRGRHVLEGILQKQKPACCCCALCVAVDHEREGFGYREPGMYGHGSDSEGKAKQSKAKRGLFHVYGPCKRTGRLNPAVALSLAARLYKG